MVLIHGLIGVFNNPIWTIALAVGQLKYYILIGSGVLLLIFPISYIALKCGAAPVSVFIIMIAVRSVYLLVVLRIISNYIPVTRHEYWKKVLFPISKTTVISLVMAAGLYILMPKDIVGTISYCILAALITVGCIWLVGVTREERLIIQNVIYNKILRK